MGLTYAEWVPCRASYSLGDKSDDLYENLADRRHTGALAVDYTGKDVYFSLNYGNVDYGNQEAKSKDSNGQAISFGGWYRFIPEARVFFGAQYSTHWEKGAGLSSSKVTVATAAEQNDGWEGYSLLLGTDYVIGSHKLIGGVQYYDGELSGNSDYNFRRTVFSAAYEYKLAKKVWLYFAATHSVGGGDLKAAADKEGLTKTTQVFTGLNFNF